MKNRLILFALILTVLTTALGQSGSARKPQTAAHSPTSTPAKQKPSPPKFLTDSLDLDKTNLGSDFHGHDITAVVDAINASPALKEKSEFESTSDFEARRGEFLLKPLYANITPNSHLAFVVDEGPSLTPQFKYDADSQTMAVTLSGGLVRFIEDSKPLNLSGVLVRREVYDHDSYIGSNAFGAHVEVSRTYSKEYGVALSPDNWIFRGQDNFLQTFTYLLSMTPDQARVVKADAKILLVCRLVPPWFHRSAHGHEATIDAPYETTVGDNYLQIEPEQLWVFNQQTGEVLRKLSESVVASGRNEQLDLKLRKTPLLLEITAGRTSILTVAIDGQPEEMKVLEITTTTTFGAKHRIVLTIKNPNSLSDIGIRLNEKPYRPNWSKEATQIGSHEFIDSATAIITVP